MPGTRLRAGFEAFGGGEAPERPDDFTEATGNGRLTNVFRLRTRRAAILRQATARRAYRTSLTGPLIKTNSSGRLIDYAGASPPQKGSKPARRGLKSLPHDRRTEFFADSTELAEVLPIVLAPLVP